MFCPYSKRSAFGASPYGTLADGVGTGLCADDIEIAVVAVFVALVLAVLIKRSPPPAAATAVLLLSLHNVAYGAPVDSGNPDAPRAVTRQTGMLAAYGALFAVYIITLMIKGTYDGVHNICIAYGWISFLGMFYAFAWVAAFVERTDPTAAIYQVLDTVGVVLGALLMVFAWGESQTLC